MSLSKFNEFIFKDLEYVECVASNIRHTLKKYLHKSTGQYIVIKYMVIPYDRHLVTTRINKRILSEIESFLTTKGHPNIVCVYGANITNDNVLLYMEHMDCSLYHLIRWSLEIVKSILAHPCIIRQIIQSLVDAISFLAYNNILHRDIKPHNVLLNIKGEIKLCDFGESILLEGSNASSSVGTIAYWPPERFLTTNYKYDIKSDIWSLGITLLEIACGKHPYEETSIYNTSFRDYLMLIQSWVSKINYEELIKKILYNYSYPNDIQQFARLCLSPLQERSSLEGLKATRLYTSSKRNPKEVEEFLLKHKPEKQQDTNMDQGENNELKLELHEILYKGEFYSVYASVYEDKEVTIKIIPYQKFTKPLHESEAVRLRSLKHKNIQEILHFESTKSKLVLISNYRKANLKTYLKDPNVQLELYDLYLYCQQIADGMSYLVEQKIVHGELNVKNILVQNKRQIFISAYGLSELFEQPDGSRVYNEESWRYLPIECLFGERPTKHSDVWSYGITCWEIFDCARHELYADIITPAALWEFLSSCKRLCMPSNCDYDTFKLIESCWHDDPTKRPSFNQLFESIKEKAVKFKDSHISIENKSDSFCSDVEEDGVHSIFKIIKKLEVPDFRIITQNI